MALLHAKVRARRLDVIALARSVLLELPVCMRGVIVALLAHVNLVIWHYLNRALVALECRLLMRHIAALRRPRLLHPLVVLSLVLVAVRIVIAAKGADPRRLETAL